jgi:Flp pilus assembly protein CpaB
MEAIMRRGRIFFYLAFIIILGLVAVVVIWQKFLQPAAQPQTNATVPAPVEMVDIVMVTQKVPRGGVLDRQVLELVPWQKTSLIDGMFTNIDDVVGRQARYELTPGVPLMSGMLVDSADQISGGGIAALSIPRGMVAVSIPVSRLSSVSYAPQSGDHVNVIVTTMFVDLDTDFQTVLPNQTLGVIAPGTGTLTGSTGQSQSQGEVQAQGSAGLSVESNSVVALSGGGGATQGRAEVDPVLGQTFYLVPSEKQRPRITSQNLIQDVIVLKMGDFAYEGQQPQVSETPQAVADGQTAAEGTTTTAPKPPDVVTLIVSPQDAVTLNYLIYSGAELTLALRAANDDSRFETEAVTLQFLLDQYNIPVPVKLPYGVEPRKDSLSLPVLQNDIAPTPAP